MEKKNVGDGTATVENVTIKGGTNIPLNANEVEITLDGVTFMNISKEANVISWFTNKPDGVLSAKPKNDVSEGDEKITIIVSGEPTKESTAVLEITIPGTALDDETPLTVTTNPDAKYDIVFGIGTAAHLDAFADEVAGGNVSLNARLPSGGVTVDATEAAKLPISRDYAHAYQGDFDGNGSKIKIALEDDNGFLALFGINRGTIHDLTVTGSVTLTEDAGTGENGADYIAGLVAYNDYDGTVEDCVNEADVTAESTSDTQPEVAYNIAGVVGFNGWDQINKDSPHFGQKYQEGTGGILRCRNDGDITGGFNKIGGIAGENASLIKECVNTGKILCAKRAQDRGWPGVGGIVGRNGNNNDAIECGDVEECYNTGEVADNAQTGAGKNAYGGITGWCDTKSNVKNCYTSGRISQMGDDASSGNVNPIIGMVDSDPENTENNYALDTIFASSGDEELAGIKKSDIEMKDPAFVTALNGEGGTAYKYNQGGYPKLSWE
jgi:hypothetical protein